MALSPTYSSASAVQQYLGIQTAFGTGTTPTLAQVNDLLLQSEDEIDRYTGHAWRIRLSNTETANATTQNYEIYDGPDVYDINEGGRVYLRHRKVRQLSYLTLQVDACEATTGWTASGTNSIATTTAQKTQGTYALTLVKSDASSATCSASKTTPASDFSSLPFVASVYVSATLYAKLAFSGAAVSIRFGSDSSNYYQQDFTAAQLIPGWNTLTFTSATATSTTGTPVTAACAYTLILFKTAATATTSSANDFVFDDLKIVVNGDALGVWNGDSYDDYLSSPFIEGKPNDFWVDYDAGILYVAKPPVDYHEGIRIKYRYGDAYVPQDIKRASTLMAAIDLIQSDDRSVILPTGGDHVAFADKIKIMRDEIDRILEPRREMHFSRRS